MSCSRLLSVSCTKVCESLGDPRMIPNVSSPRHLGIGLLTLVLLLAQVIHPWMHPQEVIAPTIDDHFICPLSHVVGDLQLSLPPLALSAAVVDSVLAPRPWVSHAAFLHPVVPRPPPTVPA